jgi:AraC-like DNA-binding protein
MDISLPDESSLSILTRPWDWKLISTLVPPDLEPISPIAANDLLDCDTISRLSSIDIRQLMRQERSVLLEAASMRRRSADSLTVALRGCYLACLDGVVYPFPIGSVLLGRVEEFPEHAVTRANKENDVLMIDVLKSSFLVRIWSVRDGTVSATPEKAPLSLTDVEAGIPFAQHWHALQDRRDLTPTDIRTRLVCAAAVLLAAAMDLLSHPERRTKEELHREVITRVREHIRDTVEHDHTLESVARLAGYSSFYFARLFRKTTGESIHEYIDSCRLAKTRELEESGLSQKQIASQLGFSSPTAFYIWRRNQRAHGIET